MFRICERTRHRWLRAARLAVARCHSTHRDSRWHCLHGMRRPCRRRRVLKLATLSVPTDTEKRVLVDMQTMSAEPIVSVRPWIRPEDMASEYLLHFTASDGMQIHGYITLPRSDGSGRPPPLLVIPHGGPHYVRDHWGFIPEPQLFASQGFAVLRVNFRGTVRAPELFRCAVGYAGVYDLTLMDNTGDMRFSGLAQGYIHPVVGEDPKALKSGSSVYNADKIQARVFLIHGKDDEHAPIKHADRLRDALTKVGRPPEWLTESKEAHGFGNEANRERMYERLLSFINRSLNLPDTVAAGAPAKAN